VSNAGPSDAHGNEDCQQTILAPVAMAPGLNTVNVSKDGALLLINEEAVVLEGKCLIDANRVALAFGFTLPPGTAQQLASDPNTIPAEPQGIRLNEMWGYSVVNSETIWTLASSTLGNVIPKLEIQSTATY
jgi:hypothetical protein